MVPADLIQQGQVVEAARVGLVLLAQGYVQLFFGYVENYTFNTLIQGVYLLAHHALAPRHPFAEDKLVRCTRGRIWDVAVDARPASETFGRWVAAELDALKGWALFLPRGFAHGFITLEHSTEVFYQCSPPYESEAATGFRWDDPEVGIAWPLEPVVVSARDRALPRLAELGSLTDLQR